MKCFLGQITLSLVVKRHFRKKTIMIIIIRKTEKFKT